MKRHISISNQLGQTMHVTDPGARLKDLVVTSSISQLVLADDIVWANTSSQITYEVQDTRSKVRDEFNELAESLKDANIETFETDYPFYQLKAKRIIPFQYLSAIISRKDHDRTDLNIAVKGYSAHRSYSEIPNDDKVALAHIESIKEKFMAFSTPDNPIIRHSLLHAHLGDSRTDILVRPLDLEECNDFGLNDPGHLTFKKSGALQLRAISCAQRDMPADIREKGGSAVHAWMNERVAELGRPFTEDLLRHNPALVAGIEKHRAAVLAMTA